GNTILSNHGSRITNHVYYSSSRMDRTLLAHRFNGGCECRRTILRSSERYIQFMDKNVMSVY
ncbi:MAG: hypothetical protein PHV06_10755, partial [bacterium]|nr:hypothetical protein [bacterium]